MGALPTFRVQTYGVLATLMDFEDTGARDATFSFLKITQKLAAIVASDWGNLGMWACMAMFVVSTALMPLLQAVLWAILWAVPLSLRNLKYLLRTSEVIAAWQFFEVFLVAVVITVLQIEDFARGFVSTIDELLGSSGMATINNVFMVLHKIGVLKEQDTAIFKLTSDLLVGSYVLLGAASILMLTGIFVTQRAEAF